MSFSKKLIYCEPDLVREKNRIITRTLQAANEIILLLNYYKITPTKAIILELFGMKKAAPKNKQMMLNAFESYERQLTPPTTESDYTETPLFDKAAKAVSNDVIIDCVKLSDVDIEKIKAILFHTLQKRYYIDFITYFAPTFKRFCAIEKGKAVKVSNSTEIITADVGIFVESEKAAKLMSLHEKANNAINAFLNECNGIIEKVDITQLFDIYNGISKVVTINYNKLVK